MSIILEDRNRIIIPTWREYKTNNLSQEHLPALLHKPKPKPIGESLLMKLEEWKDVPTLSTSLELVNSAYASNQHQIAVDAAKFLKLHGNNFPQQFHRIIAEILEEEIDQDHTISQEIAELDKLLSYIGKKINHTRKRLVEYPDNPFLWVELARLHSILGNAKKAEKSLLVAMQLSAGLNRYIVRATSRFYYHMDEYEQSSRIIRAYPNLKNDPWLLASEIAYSRKLERHTPYVKIGGQLIDSKNYSNDSISELAAMIGTHELYDGTLKNARKFTNRSLLAPNDNSLAQAEWLSRHISEIHFNSWLDKIEFAYEARAHELLFTKDYKRSMEEGFNWVIDQPISKRAVAFASYVACGIIGNYDQAVDICKFGLRTNPNTFLILNNLTYSLACNNQLTEATKYFEKMGACIDGDLDRVVYYATDGLIDYRSGNSRSGREKYEKSIELAVKLKDDSVVLTAKMNFIREQCFAGELDEETAMRTITSVYKESKAGNSDELKLIITKIEEKVKANNKQDNSVHRL